MDRQEIEAVLRKGDSERPICAYIKKNPLLISRVVGGLAYANEVAPEFCFGTDYRADFVALGPFSGGFDVHFLEMEPPNAALFTKKGNLAKRLNEALSQIENWRVYIDKHRNTVLHELSKTLCTQ